MLCWILLGSTFVSDDFFFPEIFEYFLSLGGHLKVNMAFKINHCPNARWVNKGVNKICLCVSIFWEL